MNNNKNLSLVFLAVTLSACAQTAVENKSDFITNPAYKQQLTKAQVMPTKEQLAGKSLSVLVLPTETKNKLAKKSEAGSALSAVAESLLQQAGLEIIDRAMAGKVKNELIAYESTGKFNSSSINVADVAISPVITSAKLTETFNERHEAKNIFTGKKTWVGPSCTYKAKVNGYLKNYNLPELNLRSQVELNGNARISKDTRGSRCNLSTVERYGLVTQAAENAINNYRTVLQNEFSPKAYVTEYRVVGGNHYIKINSGLNKQIQEGADIQFIQQIAVTDDLTGTVTQDQFPIGNGTVTDIIQSASSWVAVDKDVAQKLKLGDIAVVKFTTSIFEDLQSVSQTMGNL